MPFASRATQQTAFIGIVDQRDTDTVLHRVRRIAPLDLGQHGGTGTIKDTIEPDQRRVADR